MTDDLRRAAERLVPLIDLTSLQDRHGDDIAALCDKAQTPAGPVAAICTWPEHIPAAQAFLKGSGIRRAAVVNFPAGENDIAAALGQTDAALAAGAGELDLVMPYRAWLNGKRDDAKALIAAVKSAAQNQALLKVILETGALGDADSVAAASRDAIDAGADFIKTSTGKGPPGASLAAAEAMLLAIRDSHRAVGFKASGGIRTTAEAAAYLALAERIMGRDWPMPSTFRIGASSLLDDTLMVLGLGATAASQEGY